MGLQADVRAAAVTLLTDYAASASIGMQVYSGRPRALYPPAAFVDRITESLANLGGSANVAQRTPTAEIVVIHGLMDSKEAADQKDAFVDGFIVWALARPHAAGANTLVMPVATEDEPNYVPEWMPPEQQRVYYATRISLEGYAQG